MSLIEKVKNLIGVSSPTEVPRTAIIDGYEFDENGLLISVPEGRTTYVIPNYVKSISLQARMQLSDRAEIIDFSNCRVRGFGIQGGFRKLRKIIVPDSWEYVVQLSEKFILQGQSVTFNIPRNLKEFNARKDAAFNEVVDLPEGVKIIEDFSHNTCRTKICIPGSLKELPSIYEHINLEELHIGEGVTQARRATYGLWALKLITMPTTLNEFQLGNLMSNRGGSYPVFKPCPPMQEKLTIRKKFPYDSYFGATTLTFEIRRTKEVDQGEINLRFEKDRLFVNDYCIPYNQLTKDSVCHIDYQNKSLELEPLKNNEDKSVDATTTLETKIPNFDYHEFLISYMEKVKSHSEKGLRSSDKFIKLFHETWQKFNHAFEKWFNVCRQNDGIEVELKEFVPMMIATLKQRGIIISEEGRVTNFLPTGTDLSITMAYNEIVIIDYIITEFEKKIGSEKLTNCLFESISEENEEERIMIILRALRGLGLPVGFKLYSFFLTKLELERVLSYCGTQEISRESISKYIEDLKKRLQGKKTAKKD